MGSYLSQPVTDKVTNDSSFNSISAGEASMQGWRIAQEDAHNLILDYDENLKSSLFAIFDGHGGAEVAQLAAQRLPEMLLRCAHYKADIVAALENTFVDFDKHLLQEDVLKLLTSMAGIESDNEDESSMVATGDNKSESALLNEDARIPLNQLLAQYNVKIAKKDGRPILSFNGKKDASDVEGDEDKITMNGEQSEPAGSSTRHFAGVGNKSSNGNVADDGGSGAGGSKAGGSGSSGSRAGGSGAGGSGASGSGAGGSRAGGSGAGASGSGDNGKVAGGTSETSSSSITSTGVNSKIKMDDNSTIEISYSEEDDEEIDSEEDYVDEDEDDDDDGDDDLEEDDSDEDEEDESNLLPFNAMQSSGEAGFDSGCTAVVAVLRGSRLFVANAGDSRCVVSRDGVALAMSEDHKPEDQIETDRIKAAGGYVSKDGRVNSSLNLSRALGDHTFKTTSKIPLVDQMISCLPDVRSLDLDKRDQFIILACDGIWNVMSNQEVVTFVIEKMAANPPPKLSEVCSMLFDYCIAPNTSGDCVGCDNMSAVIVDLRNCNDLPASSESSTNQESPDTKNDVVLQKSRYVKVMPKVEEEVKGDDEDEGSKVTDDKDELSARLGQDVQSMDAKDAVNIEDKSSLTVVIDDKVDNAKRILNSKSGSVLEDQGPYSKKIKIDP